WRYQALIAIQPPLEMLPIWTEALTLSVIVLVVACPIAIASVVPLTYGRLMDYLFGKGVRIQNSLLVKTIANLKHLIFNKTGVLTTGVFHIQNFHTSIPSDDFKAILLALEQHSKHPYAKAIVKHFAGDVEPLDLEDIRQVNGLGIMGKDASGNTYMAGAYNIAAEFTKEDSHSIYVLKNNRLVAWLDLEDRLREEAEPCITALEQEGIKTVLLSGDRAIPTQYAARKTGIQNFHFQQLPEQKKAIVEQLQVEGLTGVVVEQNGRNVLLESASLAIELEAEPNVHKKTTGKAGVTISHHRLLLVNELIAMCSSLVHRVRWISVFAIIYNIFVVILASLGYFSLILAVLSSFIVWAVISLLLKL
ncbi:MAG: HAD-IC family P-type ATPase, partial [Chitinophagales bacterium]